MTTTLLGRFYTYQKLRFPIIILLLSLLPAILSSVAVVNTNPSIFKIALGLIVSMLYLLHIRVIDEQRDFHHDNKYHKLRPLQTGLISMKELQIIDVYAVVAFLVIAIFVGIYSFSIGLLMLGFSYLASKEFFLGKKLLRHFFLYNSINTIQTFIMQLFIYSFFVGFIPFTMLVALHYFLTGIGTIIFEFVRKIKIPGMDGTGKDTYTWHLGFNRAIIIYLLLAFLATILFYNIMIIMTGQKTMWVLLSTILFSIMLLSALIHLTKKTIKTEQLMQLSFVIVYAIFNLLIYYVVRTSASF